MVSTEGKDGSCAFYGMPRIAVGDAAANTSTAAIETIQHE